MAPCLELKHNFMQRKYHDIISAIIHMYTRHTYVQQQLRFAFFFSSSRFLCDTMYVEADSGFGSVRSSGLGSARVGDPAGQAGVQLLEANV